MKSNGFFVYTALPDYERYVDRFQMFRAVSYYVQEQNLILMNGEPDRGEVQPKNFHCVTLDGSSLYQKVLSVKDISKRIDSRQFNVIHDTFVARLSLFHRKNYSITPPSRTRVVLSLYFPVPLFLMRWGWSRQTWKSDCHDFHYNLYRALREWISCRFADGVICNSSEIAEGLTRCYGFPEGKIGILPTAVDTEYFTPISERGVKFKRQNGSFILLFVGSIIRRKGIETILKALPVVREKFPGIKMVFVGSWWDHLDWIRGELKKNNLNDVVELVGLVSRKELRRYYDAADLLVFPSLFEGSPRVVKEAASCGCPIVACRIAGVELLDPSGLYISFVNPHDFGGLAARICRLLSNPNERLEKSRRGIEYVRSRFSPSVVAEKTVDFYESLF